MKIRVEIGDEATAYEFSEDKISIGASEDCEICLPYEGIADKHLEIVSSKGQFFVNELSSGEKTYLNGELVPPLSRTQFNTFFPFEIGGILIFLENDGVEAEEELDESLNRMSRDITTTINLNKLNLVDENEKATESTTAQDVSSDWKPFDPLEGTEEPDELNEENSNLSEQAALARIESHNSESKNINKEKYKPNIFGLSDDSSSKEDSQSFKIKVPQTLTKTKIKRPSAARGKLKDSQRIRSKIQKKSKENGLGSIIILSIVLIITGAVYYLKYHKPNLKNTAITKTIIKESKYAVDISVNKLMAPYKSKYKFFVNEKKCLSPLEEKICSHFGGKEKLEEFEGVKSIDKTLYIGLSRSTLRKYATVGLEYSQVEKAQIEGIVEKEYSQFFTYDDFVKNGKKATFKVYQFNHDQYQDISRISFLILKKQFHELLEGIPEVNKVHFFVFKEFQKEVDVLSFVEFSMEQLRLELAKIDEHNLSIKLQLNSFLNEGIESFYSTKWKTHLEDFNEEKLNQFKKEEKKKYYEANFQKPNCYAENEKELCLELRAFRNNNLTDGIIIDDTKVYVLLDSIVSVNINKEKYLKHEYTVFERKQLLKNTYKNKPDFDKNSFFKNDFVMKKINPDDFQLNILVSVFLESNIIGTLKKNKNIKNVVLLGFDYTKSKVKQLTAYIEFPIVSLLKEDTGTTKVLNLYFWRSRVPVFNQYIESKSTEFRGFSEIQ
jgi:pSer/pThr/pTyr-binding forkhead associated (FHA) protein